MNEKIVRVKPSNDYLLIDSRNGSYYGLKREELDHCLDDEERIICGLHHPLYKYGAKPGICEMGLFRNNTGGQNHCELEELPMEENWIQLDNLKTWIFTMDRLRNYTMKCDGYDQAFQHCLQQYSCLSHRHRTLFDAYGNPHRMRCNAFDCQY